MNKITRMTDKGAALIVAEHYDSPEEAREDRKVRVRKAIDKLYQYETLGLEPEELLSLLQLTATIRNKLNTAVTSRNPRKDYAYKAKLGAVKLWRDEKAGQIKVSVELLDDKGNIVVDDIRHIDELKNAKFE